MATFIGIGGNDSGGQAIPGTQNATIVWANAAQPFFDGAAFSSTALPFPTSALRGPTNAAMLYTGGGGGTTPGFGQIFPTGRS